MRVLLARLLALSLLIAISGTAGAQSQQQPLKAEELDQLVAPIALYPDTLLAEVLMASTYPLEVVEASRWADENKSLKGEQLKSAADKQTWDDSVKSLTATPSVLSMMSTKLSWTQKLGDAVLAQQPDVMDAVQRLRGKAQAQNKLQTTKQQKVSVATQQNKQVIVIEPTEPNTIYVPYYDPGVVYGAWPYAAYPPYYFPPPGYIPGAAIATGLAFGAGIAVGAWAANNNFWGGGVNWGGNNININRNTNINSNNNWSHNADHRHGVRYNNADVANKFGKGGNARGNAQNRMDFRGRDGQQVLKPGGDRPGAGNRPGGGDRPGAGNRPGGGDRPSAGNRPGGGDRGNAGNRGGGQRPSGGGRDNAFSHAGGAGAARAQSNRGHASMGGGGGGARMGGGGGGFSGGGGGGARMGGGGGGGRGGGGGGGGRRSDANLKHDVVLLGHLDNGLGFYRFSYNGSEKAYVGVIAQEVQAVAPDAVTRGSDGYLRVRYDKLGLKFQTYDQWLGSGASVPAAVRVH